MNDLLNNFIEQLKGTSGGTKLVAAFVGASMLAILGIAAVVSNKPDYQLAFSGLSDHEFPEVTKALAESGVAFQVSQPRLQSFHMGYVVEDPMAFPKVEPEQFGVHRAVLQQYDFYWPMLRVSDWHLSPVSCWVWAPCL